MSILLIVGILGPATIVPNNREGYLDNNSRCEVNQLFAAALLLQPTHFESGRLC
jgi:hypothetical protein